MNAFPCCRSPEGGGQGGTPSQEGPEGRGDSDVGPALRNVTVDAANLELHIASITDQFQAEADDQIEEFQQERGVMLPCFLHQAEFRIRTTAFVLFTGRTHLSQLVRTGPEAEDVEAYCSSGGAAEQSAAGVQCKVEAEGWLGGAAGVEVKREPGLSHQESAGEAACPPTQPPQPAMDRCASSSVPDSQAPSSQHAASSKAGRPAASSQAGLVSALRGGLAAFFGSPEAPPRRGRKRKHPGAANPVPLGIPDLLVPAARIVLAMMEKRNIPCKLGLQELVDVVQTVKQLCGSNTRLVDGMPGYLNPLQDELDHTEALWLLVHLSICLADSPHLHQHLMRFVLILAPALLSDHGALPSDAGDKFLMAFAPAAVPSANPAAPPGGSGGSSPRLGAHLSPAAARTFRLLGAEQELPPALRLLFITAAAAACSSTCDEATAESLGAVLRGLLRERAAWLCNVHGHDVVRLGHVCVNAAPCGCQRAILLELVGLLVNKKMSLDASQGLYPSIGI